jgi:hypothetical protein
MMKAWENKLKVLAPLLPALVGFYGFMQVQGMTVSWALYYTLRLYGLNTDISDINVFIEVARWMAPVSIAGVLILAIKSVKAYFVTYLRTMKKDCCSVYGNSAEAADLLQNLGKSGIQGHPDRIKNTPCHVIMFDNDNDTAAFYSKNEQALKKHKVYLSMERNQMLHMKENDLFIFSAADNCAIQYWKNHLASKNEKIALIGDEELTDTLLFRGLLTNITALNQSIEYHVWKKENDFPYLYGGLKKVNMDRVIFHEQPYYMELDLLQHMNRIILCGHDADNLKVLAKLSGVLVAPEIHIKMRYKTGAVTIYGNSKVQVFGTSDELMTRDIIIKEKLLEGAKELHNSYYKLYGGKRWEELDTFTKQANLFSAEYSLVVEKLYWGGTDQETLAELVHECWCRFHYLNGWSYAEKRNDSAKQHNLLVPYKELSKEDKQKDMDIVEKAIHES